MKFLALTIAPFIALLSACSVTVQAPPQPSPNQTPVAQGSPVAKPAAPAPTQSPASTSEPPTTASIQPNDCIYAPGKAVGGQEIRADLCSVKPTGTRSASFMYYLDSERIESEVNCANGTWTTFPEGKVNRPQSVATENMVTLLCDRLNASPSSRTAIVFDPPSNVRASPNGQVLCSVKEKTTIRILGSEGSWYKTDVCGAPGFIEAGQLQF